MNSSIFVTGGAGFIGSAMVRRLIAESEATVVNIDVLTYAGNLNSLDQVAGSSSYSFEQVDIRDMAYLRRIFAEYQPHTVFHLAAESHVDRSIDGPAAFVDTNVVGTYSLLEVAREYWYAAGRPEGFRFIHTSTDEVFGTLGDTGHFDETTPYAPNSPYAATKAAADHLVRAWHQTYGLPVITTNCSNNYGPYQFPEKLIPHIIISALEKDPLPVYGDGRQVRDWLHVDDHVDALLTVMQRGRTERCTPWVGETSGATSHSVRRFAPLLTSSGHDSMVEATLSKSPTCPTGRATTVVTPLIHRRSRTNLTGDQLAAWKSAWRQPSGGISNTNRGGDLFAIRSTAVNDSG